MYDNVATDITVYVHIDLVSNASYDVQLVGLIFPATVLYSAWNEMHGIDPSVTPGP